ncbi:MAG: PQQ-binding-like beta-propeller repeat protein [Acidobacteria bacterium]|nr:PQQ-binding-like beta-propeller repeat protein [Acidobacteriota bacterium]
MSQTRRLSHALLTAALVLVPATLVAEDWRQLLGPRRDGTYNGGDLAASWPESGPKTLWQREVGHGFSNPVVVGGRLILFHRVGDEELIESLDALTGKPEWTFRYATSYRDGFGFDPGPRASPVVAGSQVYTFSPQGILHCVRLTDGKKVWRVDTHQEFDADKGYFGAASTPLLDGTSLFLNVGGSGGAGIIAFDKDTGRVLWKATDDEASYSSPVMAEIAGRKLVVFFTREGLKALDPKTGDVRYAMRWRSRSNASVNAALPLVIGNRVFLSSSYGTGAVLLDLGGGEVKQVWSSDDSLSNHYATSVHKAGYLYGFHGRQEYGQVFRAVELATGKLRWEQEGFRAGTVTLANDRLLILAENGELVMAAASPDGFKVFSRAKILDGVVRAYPALADGRLYARNESRLICVDLR